MKWDRLKVFYQVVKSGSFSAAAAQMHVNQSSVSRGVQQLEKTYNKPLILRQHNGLRLTEAGEIVFGVVERVIANVDTIPQSIDKGLKLPNGALRLMTSNVLADLWLPHYMPGFLESYPDITFAVLADDSAVDLTAYAVDVTIGPYNAAQHTFVQRYLTTLHLGLYASPQYLERYGTPQTVDDLDNHRLLVFDEPGERDWLLCLGRSPNKPREPFICINSRNGLHQLAEKSVGIVILSPEYPALKDLNLVRVLPSVEGPAIDIYYAYPKSVAHVRCITVFADYLEEILQSKKQQHKGEKAFVC